jgi:hypothetical protein
VNREGRVGVYTCVETGNEHFGWMIAAIGAALVQESEHDPTAEVCAVVKMDAIVLKSGLDSFLINVFFLLKDSCTLAE